MTEKIHYPSSPLRSPVTPEGMAFPAAGAASPATVWFGELSGERAGRFVLTTAQLGVLLLALHVFQVEQASGLLKLTGLIFGGFLVHAALPLRHRAPFFLLLSLAGFGLVLGTAAVLLVGIGLVLIGACHLPMAFRWRVALVAGLGVLLAGLRGARWSWLPWGQDPMLVRVLPVVGAIFMFRLIIYLYDLRHEPQGREPVSVWRRLGYFFLLPNVCFLLFPIIDYRTYRTTYYDTDPLEIYQRGVQRVFRGLTHLLLYRVVYYYLTPAPDAVVGLGGVVLFVLSAWLLYLRVSGVFHLTLGILGLFGHNVPEVMRLYFLASSPNDLWRRANIYWKDFMMKVFYYPVFKPLQKRWGLTGALVGATLVVFVVTWWLHSYQWFWVLGTFPLTGLDAAFWTIFAVLVLANSLWELKRGRRRVLTPAQQRTWSLGGAVVHTAQVLAMFVFMAGMWSWWSTRDTGRWVSILARGAESGAVAFAILGLGLAGVLGVGVLVQYVLSRGWTFGLTGAGLTYRQSVLATSLGAVLVMAMGLPSLSVGSGTEAGAFIASLRTERLNTRDAELRNASYYSSLLETNQSMWQQRVWGGRLPGDEKPLWATDEFRMTGDARFLEIRASLNTGELTTNEWGMRDKAYTLEKPAGTFRIAVLGGSLELGLGVEQGNLFEAILENRLNREHAGRPYARYEILNFAVPKYAVLQQAVLTEQKVTAFRPDVVLLTSHADEIPTTSDILIRLVVNGTELPPFVQDLVRRQGVRSEMEPSEIRRRLLTESFFRELYAWGYRQIAELCRRNGSIPAWVLLPTLGELPRKAWSESITYMREAAVDAGFVVLDAAHAFEGRAAEDVSIIRDGTPRPSTMGHQLIADHLYELLRANDTALRLRLPNGPNPSPTQ